MNPAGTATSIRRATTGDLATIAGILAAAFQDGDLADWLIPDPGLRRRAYPPYFAMLTDHALTHGHVDLLGEEACAVWYDTTPAPPIEDYDQRLAVITGPALHRFQTLDQAMHAHHDREPHTYLAFLAALPGRQSHGHGSALLRHHHARLDQPAYLEATGPRNSALYARHGYRRLEAYRLTEDGPHLYPMLRTRAGT
ncbi:GNAT family N-acetyltransferase [Actinoplanes sp. NPDC020271]|uniref:GNAT family N-acetyltransferase n=1 Tax=Actinoplanes sp. NPDC020271 TaxID=3363896 RepID=UPI0037B25AF1